VLFHPSHNSQSDSWGRIRKEGELFVFCASSVRHEDVDIETPFSFLKRNVIAIRKMDHALRVYMLV